jgi:hypothetical protein
MDEMDEMDLMDLMDDMETNCSVIRGFSLSVLLYPCHP